ncbi:MAG: hypothetical protein Q8O89_07205 [Nanoarchaeota archaeon]|nr:hypothetical protein [Nanoarchaeota archaeon]
MYCRTDLTNADWVSVHDGGMHYKAANCPCCNVQIRLKAGFDGSGHDDWSGKKQKKFRNTIRTLDTLDFKVISEERKVTKPESKSKE